ncbi:MAG: type VI secretion system tip protein VgrG, partial [Planctomycetes bacterium]|nr:type VI secretion system tip protein VgrG [Planctomycetota bacterium]
MALVRDLSKAQIAFQVGDGPVDQFDVVRYRGTEGLCQLYRFEIELVTDDEEVSFDDVVGKSATLSINSETGTKWFHGIISRFEFTGEANGRMKFRAELVPAVWLLTHRYNSRIFQQKTVKEIITTVLEMGGIPSDRIKLGGVKGADLPREYCVQYRETDFNFICRLMEEEGIWWYFEQTQEGHTFRAADNKSEYVDIEGESAELPFKPPSGMLAEEEHVFSFRKAQSVRFGKVVLNDFNFKNPKLNLESLSDAGRDTSLEFFDYPGEYDAQAIGGNLAKMRVEEFEASRTRGV